MSRLQLHLYESNLQLAWSIDYIFQYNHNTQFACSESRDKKEVSKGYLIKEKKLKSSQYPEYCVTVKGYNYKQQKNAIMLEKKKLRKFINKNELKTNKHWVI